jgi:hypothetical protein
MRLCFYHMEENNPTKVLDNNSFYTIVVYNYKLAPVSTLILRQESKLLCKRIQ